MSKSDKLRGLIDSLKTSNELMKKQIELSNRTIELIGEYITEPESVELNKAVNWWVSLTNEQQWNYRIELIGHRGGVLTDSEILQIWRKKNQPIEPTNIKPEDMKEGEWYVVEVIGSLLWLIKVRVVENEKIYTEYSCNLSSNNQYNGNSWRNYPFCSFKSVKSIRPATREEVTRFSPHEFEIPTHGGNDAGHIQQFTDPQL